jgi:hypothetical protein
MKNSIFEGMDVVKFQVRLPRKLVEALDNARQPLMQSRNSFIVQTLTARMRRWENVLPAVERRRKNDQPTWPSGWPKDEPCPAAKTHQCDWYFKGTAHDPADHPRGKGGEGEVEAAFMQRGLYYNDYGFPPVTE